MALGSVPIQKTFVVAKTNADRLILREDVNDVYFGKDHYYIEKTDPENLLTPQLYENLDYLSDAPHSLILWLGQSMLRSCWFLLHLRF